MLVMLFALILAIATGAVTGGLTGSVWAMATGERPGLYLLTERSLATPLKVAVFVLNAPLLIVERGWTWLDDRPLLGVIAILLSGLWLFLQGVVILTKVFGVT
jgi:hypothetical protein